MEPLKTTVRLPQDLCREMRIAALDDRSSSRTVVAGALGACLEGRKKGGAK